MFANPPSKKQRLDKEPRETERENLISEIKNLSTGKYNSHGTVNLLLMVISLLISCSHHICVLIWIFNEFSQSLVV